MRRTRWILGAVLVALPAPVGAISRTRAAVAESNGGVRVMPLGDSSTEGTQVPGGYRIGLWQRRTGPAVRSARPHHRRRRPPWTCSSRRSSRWPRRGRRLWSAPRPDAAWTCRAATPPTAPSRSSGTATATPTAMDAQQRRHRPRCPGRPVPRCRPQRDRERHLGSAVDLHRSRTSTMVPELTGAPRRRRTML